MMTGSFYGEEELLDDFYGEDRFDDGSTIVQKTHHRSILQRQYEDYGLEWREHHMKLFNNRWILLIRNPYKALISYWELTQTQDHTGSRGIDQYVSSSSSFDRHVKTGAARWLELILDWAEHCIECHLVFFEVNILQIPRFY